MVSDMKGPERGYGASTTQDKVPGRGAPSPSAVSSTANLSLERFAKTFETSTRRWEMIVYPSLFGFIILAIYGFYLVYSLTRDMSTLAESMDPQMQPHMDTLAVNVEDLAKSIGAMTERVGDMASSVENIDGTLNAMDANLSDVRADVSEISRSVENFEPMLLNFSQMNIAMYTMAQDMRAITMSVGILGRDVGIATHQFARPMSVMNSFFPW